MAEVIAGRILEPYYKGGPLVTLYDGGTEARDAISARRNLGALASVGDTPDFTSALIRGLVSAFPSAGVEQDGYLVLWDGSSGTTGDVPYRAANKTTNVVTLGVLGQALKAGASIPGYGWQALAVVDLTNQAGNLGPTTIIAPTTGLYRVSVVHLTTTAGAAGTLATTIAWTDENGAQSLKPAPDDVLSGLGYQQGSVVIYPSSGNLTYQTVLTGVVGSPKYSLHIAVERLF